MVVGFVWVIVFTDRGSLEWRELAEALVKLTGTQSYVTAEFHAYVPQNHPESINLAAWALEGRRVSNMATQHKQAELCVQGRYVSVYSHVRYNYTFHISKHEEIATVTDCPSPCMIQEAIHTGVGPTRVHLHWGCDRLECISTGIGTD